MKQEYQLTAADFVRYPVWIGVHNYDSDEAWYDEADEETYRPWTGALPFAEKRGIVLVRATFELADGSTLPGYCSPRSEDWDVAPAPYMTKSGIVTLRSWSATHGGTKLSLMALLNPSVFVGCDAVGFHLGAPSIRADRVRQFYSLIGKRPSDVFPVKFAADKKFATGIGSGQLDGLFYFPVNGSSYEIDTGESSL